MFSFLSKTLLFQILYSVLACTLPGKSDAVLIFALFIGKIFFALLFLSRDSSFIVCSWNMTYLSIIELFFSYLFAFILLGIYWVSVVCYLT